MASGHGVDKPNKAEHPGRKVSKDSFGQGEPLMKVGGTYHAMGGITPEIEDSMSHDEWLRYNMRKFGPGNT